MHNPGHRAHSAEKNTVWEFTNDKTLQTAGLCAAWLFVVDVGILQFTHHNIMLMWCYIAAAHHTPGSMPIPAMFKVNVDSRKFKMDWRQVQLVWLKRIISSWSSSHSIHVDCWSEEVFIITILLSPDGQYSQYYLNKCRSSRYLCLFLWLCIGLDDI